MTLFLLFIICIFVGIGTSTLADELNLPWWVGALIAGALGWYLGKVMPV